MRTQTCPACTSEFPVSGSSAMAACPYCGTELPGSALNCPACGQANPADADFCQHCQEPLGSVTRILTRYRQDATPLWLQQARSRANHIKQSEEQASLRRLEEFQRIDQQRSMAEADKAQQKRQQERRTLLIALGLAAAIAILTLTYVLIRLI